MPINLTKWTIDLNLYPCIYTFLLPNKMRNWPYPLLLLRVQNRKWVRGRSSPTHPRQSFTGTLNQYPLCWQWKLLNENIFSSKSHHFVHIQWFRDFWLVKFVITERKNFTKWFFCDYTLKFIHSSITWTIGCWIYIVFSGTEELKC